MFEQKKLLQPLLGTPEGTKMTGTIFCLTSPTLTVYSSDHACVYFADATIVHFSPSEPSWLSPRGSAVSLLHVR